MFIDVYCALSGERVEERAGTEQRKRRSAIARAWVERARYRSADETAQSRRAPARSFGAQNKMSSDDLGAASVSDVLSELQSAFSTADAELEQAITRVSGMKEDDASLSACGAPAESAEWHRQSDAAAPRLRAARDAAHRGRWRRADFFARARFHPRRLHQDLRGVRAAADLSAACARRRRTVADRATQSAKVSVQASADEELQRANASLEAQLEMARGRLREQTAEAEAAAATAEKALGGLRQKISQQSHAMKKNEAETQRLRSGWRRS